MKLKKEFVTYDTDGKQIMVSVDTKRFSGMVKSNETAAFIINCLKEETDADSIVEKMLQEYDAPREVIAKDVQKVIVKLQEIGALDV
ncbi:MAG: PqqD family protein [Solobacterium sp.]|nr:PqqD family protein [Solobacterium sp.]